MMLLNMVLLVLMSNSFVDDQEWLGREFMSKPDAKYLLNGNEVPCEKIILPFTVSKIDGDRLWIGKAWIKKSEVVSLEDAPGFFTEYLRKNPKDPWGYNRRGIAWSSTDNLDNALTDFTRAIRLDRIYVTAFFNRGVVWDKKDEFDNAIRDYDEAIRLDPEYVLAYFNRGQIWYELDEYDKAITDYTEVIRLDPKDATAFNERGVAWNAKGEADKAIKDYTKAIWLDSEFVYAYTNRGSIWDEKGDYYKAFNDYTEACRLDPKDEVACNYLAWFLATCRDAEYRDGVQAITLGEKACESSEWKEADYIDTLAAAYAESGDFDQAFKYQRMSLEKLGINDDQHEYVERLKLYTASKPYRESKINVSSD